MASAALGEAQILESSFMPAVAAQACRLAARWLVHFLELLFTRAGAAQACRLQRPGACGGIVGSTPPPGKAQILESGFKLADAAQA